MIRKIACLALCLAFSTSPALAGASDAAVAGVLQRTIGAAAARHFTFQPSPGCVADCVDVRASGGKVVVAGSGPAAQLYGVAAYLRDTGIYHESWEGKRSALPAVLPDGQVSSSSPFRLRAYLNVCAFGYSTAWWDWPRWEREIDWMALHGVNLPTAMEGQEYVWRLLWKEMGLSDADLTAYFAGPAFLPWQRMGNIGAHGGPLPAGWIDSRHGLQLRILDRMRALGMEPVTPAFGGHVPGRLRQLYPEARIHHMKEWNPGFAGVYWLDPRDPLFARIAKRFMELYRETYGPSRYHLADAFNEVTPPVDAVSKLAELADYGDILFRSVRAADPQGVWVMQSWMFGHDKQFWTKDAVRAFFSKVPDEGVLIEDIGNDRYQLWQQLDAFGGKPWIFGFIHNYGGTDAVYGDFRAYRRQLAELEASPGRGKLLGYGVFPEGIENNSAVYDYLFDLPWRGRTDDWSGWSGHYLAARYGKLTPRLTAAWNLLRDAVYSTPYWTTRWWRRSAGTYLLEKRPSTALVEFEGHPGDDLKLRAALDLLLLEADQYRGAPLFSYDLAELGRHYLAKRADAGLQKAIAAYQGGQVAQGDAAFAHAATLIRAMDALAAGQGNRSLAAATAAARRAGGPAAERNARAIVTIWGGEHLHDYASRSWQGLLAGFYLPRWTHFMDGLRQAALAGQRFDDAAFQDASRRWEEAWVAAPPAAPVPLAAGPAPLLRAVLKDLP